MQHTADIPYEQLIEIIKHLPPKQLAQIKSDLDNSILTLNAENEKTDFQEFLPKGPVMSDIQYAAFKEQRKAFNQWRTR